MTHSSVRGRSNLDDLVAGDGKEYCERLGDGVGAGGELTDWASQCSRRCKAARGMSSQWSSLERSKLRD